MKEFCMASSQQQNISPTLKKVLAPIVLILTLVIIGLAALKTQLSKAPSSETESFELKVGAILPGFSWATSPGNASQSIQDLGANLILLNFWATWCEACMEEMPSLVKLRNQFHKDGFEVIGVNLDENPDSAIEKTKQKYQIEFPLVKDPDGKLSDMLDVHAIPSTVVFDKNRRILFLKDGGRDWYSQEAIGQVKQWLGK